MLNLHGDETQYSVITFQATGYASGRCMFPGFEQANNTGARNASWGFGNIDGSITPSKYVPWYGGYPSATTTSTRTYFFVDWNAISDINGEAYTCWAICEYGKELFIAY
jgi:hypothetical protein